MFECAGNAVGRRDRARTTTKPTVREGAGRGSITLPAMQAPTPRSEVRRLPERAVYDRKAINAILDEALICHVGFVEDGSPFVIPTNYARVETTPTSTARRPPECSG